MVFICFILLPILLVLLLIWFGHDLCVMKETMEAEIINEQNRKRLFVEARNEVLESLIKFAQEHPEMNENEETEESRKRLAELLNEKN